MYGIIGYPLTHSFSPAYFSDKFRSLGMDAQYLPFPLASIEDLPRLLLDRPTLKGLNVTIPYKESVIPFLDELDEVAGAIGAVNTITIKQGKLKGYNTDVPGFMHSLQPLLQAQQQQALVLGTGGASKAVQYALYKMAISYQVVSRSKKAGVWTYDELSPELVRDFTLIINTTPQGMWPHTTDCPDIPYEAIGSRHLLFDLIYNPSETLFLQKGDKQGALTKNGYEMLVAQAEAAWAIWQQAIRI